MAIQIKVKVRGDKELISKMDKIGKEVAALVKPMALAATLIRDEAKVRVPFDTGALKKSIRSVRVGVSKSGVQFSIRAGSKKAFYAHMIEFGTMKKAARPFLRPAIDAKKDETLRMISDGYWSSIRKLT